MPAAAPREFSLWMRLAARQLQRLQNLRQAQEEAAPRAKVQCRRRRQSLRVKPTVQADHRGAVWWVVFLWASADLVEDTVGAS